MERWRCWPWRIGKRRATPSSVAAVHNDQGAGHLYGGRLLEAEQALEQARVAYLHAGSRYGAAITRLNLAVISESRGLPAQACEQLELLLQECREIGQVYVECLASGNLAYALHELGSDAKAWKHAQHALTLAHREDDRYLKANSHGAAAQAAQGLRDWAGAIEHAGQAALHHAAMHATELVRTYQSLAAPVQCLTLCGT